MYKWDARPSDSPLYTKFATGTMRGWQANQNALVRRVNSQTRTRRKAAYFGAFRSARSRKAKAFLRPTETKIPRNLLALRSQILERADLGSAAAKTQQILSDLRVF